MSRQHFFGGVDLLQEFPENQSYMEQTYGHDFEQSKEIVVKKYEPNDLGIEFFNVIHAEYKNRRRVTTYSADALFDFWKVLNRSNDGKPRPPMKNVDSKPLQDQLKHKSDLHFFSQVDPRDAKYTLKKYSTDLQEDANISKFVQERQSYLQQEEGKNKKVDEKSRKQAQERLYQKREQIVDPADEILSQRNKQVEDVIQLYKTQNPEAKDFRYPDLLRMFWKDLPRTEQPKLNEEDFQTYFEHIMECISEGYLKKYGYYCEEPNKLVKYWKDSNLYIQFIFESEYNLYKLLKDYVQQKKDQENFEIAKRQQERQIEMKNKKEKLQKSVLGDKKIQKTELQVLSQPKDRLKVGKTLLELKKMYPNDKILRKMLLQEFKDTKVAKHPLEYDRVDSDEENKQKMRHQSQRTGVISLEEMELPNKLKAEEIAELFQHHLEEYYSEKQTQLRKEAQKQKEIQKQDHKLKKYIEGMAQQYLKLRKRKLEEQVPTINQYMETVYKALKREHKEATQRNFPHRTEGESKKLRQKSYPSSLKRFFFAAMKQFVRRKYDYIKDKSNRLGFWAPPNGLSMCVAHGTNCPPGCNRQTLNARVHPQTKLVKEASLYQDRSKTSVWDTDAYMKERQCIMMTLTDAKECTFQPAVCSRMPTKLKKIMLETHTWAEQNVGKSGSIEHFVHQFGENFKKVPMIYRYGIYKRAQLWESKGEYRRAYKSIAETFNIPDLKIIFKDPSLKKHTEHPIFSNQALGLEAEQMKKHPHENMQLAEPEYQEKPEYKFLFEVYQFVKRLENYEAQLVKVQSNVQKMLQSDQHKPSRFAKSLSAYELRQKSVKAEMCPLGQQCPSIQTRWPNSNTTGITPLGANCCFAHHNYELRFAQELKARRNCLKATLNAIKQKFGGQNAIVPWNPSGNDFKDCIGCSEKTLCANCALKKKNIKALEKLRTKAKDSYKKITQKQSFKNKKHMHEAEAERYNIKIGCLSRATALYNKERYSQAFEVILRAIEIVKKELEEKSISIEHEQQQLKQKLKLDEDLDITMKQVYMSTMQTNQDDPLEAQKLHMFAHKTGLDHDPEPDTNHFINTQIEILYKKIELKLEGTVKDIQMMKDKIEKLEDLEDQKIKSKSKDQKLKKMCPDLLNGICHKGKSCKYVHNYLELDMVPTDNKISNLALSVKVRGEQLRDSKPPIPWVASSIKDQEKYTDTRIYDAMLEKEATIRSKSKSKKSESKDFYSQDIEDLKTPVHERKRKQ